LVTGMVIKKIRSVSIMLVTGISIMTGPVSGVQETKTTVLAPAGGYQLSENGREKTTISSF
jgi:hypothetical protein